VTTLAKKIEVGSPSSAELLLQRIRTGDRAAMAEAVGRHGPLIRRYIRTKLSRSLRRLLDTGDVLGTVSRRLDHALARGRVDIQSEQHLLALLQRMVKHAIVDKHRLLERLEATEGADSQWAHGFLDRVRSNDGEDVDGTLDEAMAALENETDRTLLSMWLHGLDHRDIAERLDLKPDTVRQRWLRIRTKLADRLARPGA